MDQDNQYWKYWDGFQYDRMPTGAVGTMGQTIHTIILGIEPVPGYAYYIFPHYLWDGQIIDAVHDGATHTRRPFSFDSLDCYLYLSGCLPCHGNIYVPGIHTGQEKRLPALQHLPLALQWIFLCSDRSNPDERAAGGG